LYVEGDLERVGGFPLPVGITYASLMSPDGVLLNIIASIRISPGFVKLRN